jgi:hypothetical protein
MTDPHKLIEVVEKPDYPPAHRIPAWVSTEDVLNLLNELAMETPDDDSRVALIWRISMRVKQLS